MRFCRRAVAAVAGLSLLGSVACDDTPPARTTPSAGLPAVSASGSNATAAPSTAASGEKAGARGGDRDEALWKTLSTSRADGDWPKPGRYERKLELGSQARRYVVQIPPGYQADAAAPLLLVLHDGGATPEGAAEHDRWVSLGAAQSKYITVFPEGGRAEKGGFTWGGDLCAAPAAERVDEVAFFRKLLEKLRADLSVDPRRIFAMGFAAGGRMTQRLGSELADQLAAIVPIAGASICAVDGGKLQAIAKPKEPMSVMQLFGGKDPSLPVEGGASDGVDGKVTVGSVADMTKIWTDAAQCEETAETKGRPDDPIKTFRYSCPKTGREVITIIINGEGHSVPTRVGNKPTMDLITRFLNGQTRRE